MQIPFDNTYANLPTHFHHMQGAEPVSNPALIVWNSDLARELGIVAQDKTEIAGVFSGNQTANGSAPLAQAHSTMRPAIVLVPRLMRWWWIAEQLSSLFTLRQS